MYISVLFHQVISAKKKNFHFNRKTEKNVKSLATLIRPHTSIITYTILITFYITLNCLTLINNFGATFYFLLIFFFFTFV